MSDIKKKCVVVTFFDEGQPGFLDFSYRIKSLAQHYELTIISSFQLKHKELQVENASYVVINKGHGRLAWLKYLLACTQFSNRLKPDVVVLLHSMVAPVAMMLRGIPSIVYWNEHPTHVAPSVEGFSPIKSGVRFLVRWVMFQGARSASLVMPIGEAHKDDLLSQGCQSSRVQLIYMGVDESFCHQVLNKTMRQNDAPLRLLYVGTVHEERGRDVMLEALAIANKEKEIAHLNIVGANEEQSKICNEALIRLGAEKFVTVHGRVQGQLIPMYMQEADVGLCLWADRPWYHYNPPTKLFEYLVAGLPVLASNIRTHTEYIKDQFNGMIFEYNAQSLADAILKLWHERGQIPQLSQNVIQSNSNYQWSNIEPQFLKAVKEVCRA